MEKRIINRMFTCEVERKQFQSRKNKNVSCTIEASLKISCGFRVLSGSMKHKVKVGRNLNHDEDQLERRIRINCQSL